MTTQFVFETCRFCFIPASIFSAGSQDVSPSLGLVGQREGVVRRRGQTDGHIEANSAAKCDLEGEVSPN